MIAFANNERAAPGALRPDALVIGSIHAARAGEQASDEGRLPGRVDHGRRDGAGKLRAARRVGRLAAGPRDQRRRAVRCAQTPMRLDEVTPPEPVRRFAVNAMRPDLSTTMSLSEANLAPLGVSGA